MKEIKNDLNSVKDDLNSVKDDLNSVKNDLSSFKNDLNSVKIDLSSFNETVSNLSARVSNLDNHQNELSSTLNLKLDSVNVSVREAIESQLEEHQTQTTSKLAGLQRNVTMELAGLHTSLQSNYQQLTQLSTDVDTLDSKLNASMREDLRAIESQLEEHQTQTTSKLAGLQRNVTKELAGLHTSLQSNYQQLTQLSTDVDTLDSKLNASMREDLRAIESQLEEHQTQTTSKLAELQSNVTSELHSSMESYAFNEQLITKMDTLDSKLVSVNASMREEIRAIESQLEEHQTQTVFTLAGLHSFLQSHTYTEELTEISTKIDTLDSKIDSVNNSGVLIREDLSCIKEDLSSLNETMNRISEDVEEHDNHTTTELMNLECLQRNTTVQPIPTQQPLHTCGGAGWRRVVYLDMTDPNTNCPSGWQLTSYSKRTCGKVSTGTLTCDSVTFPVSGGYYSRVCGRIIAYQNSHIDAFETYHDGEVTTIDGAYVSGVSLTHGSPRQHIWTFAAGASETGYTWDDACPCDATISITIPPFVGGDYFCESGVNLSSTSGFHADDPLWDGQNCIATSTCCSFNSPPYFTKQLPSPTTDDIEARMCWWDSGDGSPIEFIELYVQ